RTSDGISVGPGVKSMRFMGGGSPVEKRPLHTPGWTRSVGGWLRLSLRLDRDDGARLARCKGDLQHLVHRLDQPERDSLADRLGELLQVLLVLLRNDTVFTPARVAATTFSFKPPIGSTVPRSVISPVIATSSRVGTPVRAETSAVAIVIP